MQQHNTLFLCYHSKDGIWKNQLDLQLQDLEIPAQFISWDDRKMDLEGKWIPTIQEIMENTSVMVCLVSDNFLSSGFNTKEEFLALLERRKREGMHIIPILLDPCSWEEYSWLKSTRVIPEDFRSVSESFHNKEQWSSFFSQAAQLIVSLLNTTPTLLKKSGPQKIEISRLPSIEGELFGRQKELDFLDNTWKENQVNILILNGISGVGKSALLQKWLENLKADQYREAHKIFAWSFSCKETRDVIVSADQFIVHALQWFGDIEPDKGSPWGKGQRLAKLVEKERSLLILDGIEALQSHHDSDRGKIQDAPLFSLLRRLAHNNPGLCILTTEEDVSNFQGYPHSVQEIRLEKVSPQAGRAILRNGGASGKDNELESLAKDFDQHPLALYLLAAYLNNVENPIEKAKEIPNHGYSEINRQFVFPILEAFCQSWNKSPEIQLLRILSLFDAPITKKEASAVFQGKTYVGLTDLIQQADWEESVKKLHQNRLITRKMTEEGELIDCHSRVKEFFSIQLQENFPEEKKEAHERLYEFYRQLPEKHYPDTLEEMSPLFRAVAHGCLCENVQSTLYGVYWERIRRGNEAYCVKHLGAFGASLSALSYFFTVPWSEVSPLLGKSYRIGVLNWAGIRLRALGRFREAAESFQAVMEITKKEKKWEDAARSAGTLSELYWTMGNIEQCVEFGWQGVKLADLSEGWKEKKKYRTILADALHQAGKMIEAESRFKEAELMQRKKMPVYPYLFSLAGFQYCDLLLGKGEYGEARKRAWKSLDVAIESSADIFSIALDHLTLGRSMFLETQKKNRGDFKEALAFIEQSLEGLRSSGFQNYLPLGLLSRAALFRAQKEYSLAHKDLDEVCELTETGGMLLHLVDYHLESARLCQAEQDGTKAIEHLGQARALIEKTGYYRRKEELEQ